GRGVSARAARPQPPATAGGRSDAEIARPVQGPGSLVSAGGALRDRHRPPFDGDAGEHDCHAAGAGRSLARSAGSGRLVGWSARAVHYTCAMTTLPAHETVCIDLGDRRYDILIGSGLLHDTSVF